MLSQTILHHCSTSPSSSSLSLLQKAIVQSRTQPLTCVGSATSSSQRSMSYSVEIVPPRNRNSGDEFDHSLRTLLKDNRIAFVSIGSREPLLHSAHVKRALQIFKTEREEETQGARLVVNVCCRGLGDLKAADATRDLLVESGVKAVCVLGGVGPASADDAFTRPTELLKHWGSDSFEDYVVGANVGPFENTEAQQLEYRIMQEKASLGATVILSRPTFQTGLAQQWVNWLNQPAAQKQQQLQDHKGRNVVCAASYIAAAPPKLFAKLAARSHSGTLHPMVQKRLSAALLPMHPASPLSEDDWEKNLARIFERDGTQVLAYLASEEVLHVDQEAQHVHIVSYGETGARHALLFMEDMNKMMQLPRSAA